MKNLTLKILVLFCSLLVSSSCNIPTKNNSPTPPKINSYNHRLEIGNAKLDIEIAKTASELTLGLSNRENMSESQGMLFDFTSNPGTPVFWMKDMKFNLDLIWINKNKIIGITEDVPYIIQASNFKLQDLPHYLPPSTITYVLEVNAGWSKRNNIKIGNEIVLK